MLQQWIWPLHSLVRLHQCHAIISWNLYIYICVCVCVFNTIDKIYYNETALCLISDSQGLSGPRWQQLTSRQFSVSAGLCGPDGPPTRADATFKVTMIPGDGVGPELMTAVKEVFKVYNLGCSCHECMKKICSGSCRFLKGGRCF